MTTEPRKRFDELTRTELLEAIHVISAKLRAARGDLQDARGVDRDEVARLRNRVTRLSTAVSAAHLELAKRNHRRDAFLRAAREQLSAKTFNRINEAANSAAI